MSCGLVVVKKNINGEDFANTYGIMLGDDAVPLTEADLAAMVDLPTLGADQTIAVSPKIINAIVDFEIALCYSPVQFMNVYVTDSRNTTQGGDPTTIFLSKNLNVVGNRAVSAGDALAPGSIALMINRAPGGFSARQGRLLMRGALQRSAVGVGGPKLVGWADSTQSGAYNTAFLNAVNTSGLGTHLVGGSNVAGGVLGIPHYQKASTPPAITDGNLIGMTPVASLAMVRPISRQVAKGRKEK